MNKRELKFRAWNNEQKKFEYFELHNITVPDRLLIQDKFPVQQWTGEFDKNKKEIYEGDIVRVTSEEWGNENFLAEVIFSEASFLSKIDDNDIRGLWGGDDIEVVGNIFQLPCNPDHNGECLVCDAWLSDCPFNKNEDDKVIEIMGQKFNQHWAEQLLDVCKTTSIISDEQISLDLPEKYKPEFEEFMRGKTCPILDNGQRGVYSWDFEQYLKTVLKNMKNEKE